MYSHLIYFLFVSCAFGVIKEIFDKSNVMKILSMRFIILALKFRSFIQIIVLHMDIQFSQHCVLNRLSFPPLNGLCIPVEIIWAVGKFISGFYSICLCVLHFQKIFLRVYISKLAFLVDLVRINTMRKILNHTILTRNLWQFSWYRPCDQDTDQQTFFLKGQFIKDREIYF